MDHHTHYTRMNNMSKCQLLDRCSYFPSLIKQINVLITCDMTYNFRLKMNSQQQLRRELSFPEKVQKLQTFILYNVGGPKVNLFRLQLDFFKGTTFLWVIFLMHYFQNYSASMYLYLFLHGTYGICWIVKDFWFPDARILQPASLGSQCVLFLLLSSYWMIPLPLAAGYARMIFLVVVYLSGVILMMGADYQKTSTLRERKGLISNGFFKYSRNPNYLGQILIYSSFVLCSGHILGFLIFYVAGGFLFAINIYVKEQCSYKKKEGWPQYSQQSYILLPKIFQTFWLNFAFYCILFIAIVNFLAQECSATFLYPLVQ